MPENKLEFNQFYLKDVSFVNLMNKRIFNILLIANPYDAFMLEDDGRIDEKIFIEYSELGLRYPPRFTQVSTAEEAKKVLETISFDLVICMPGTDNNDAFDIARPIKQQFPDITLVVLTPFSHGITRRMQDEDLSMFDYVFCWLGNTDLLLSIIKLIEDKQNLKHDTEVGGVQMILLVEDSIRFYSSVLPNLYKFILKQSQNFATEALNAHQATLRMRGRPKIVLARNYEEAKEIFDEYKDCTLGVISDARFPHNGVEDPEAGFEFLEYVHSQDEYIPRILQSSESKNVDIAYSKNIDFVDKNSKAMAQDLQRIISRRFGFGDLVLRNPETMEEVARIHNLKELQDNIFTLPKESLLYHISRNNVSRWLCSRALFPISEFLKHITWKSLQDVDAHRQIIYDAIVKYRKMRNRGVVAEFKSDRFDRFSNFARIGDGSLGGKGRGLAFIDNMVIRHEEFQSFDNAQVAIPKTVVLCTDIFDEFMESNNLYQIALSDTSDENILAHFLRGKLPQKLLDDLFAFIDVVKSPIAIRSSSLLEDSHYQPFAGIYSTYMIPYVNDKYEMVRMLSDAVKSVYASVYYQDSKDYMTATRNVIDQEKMAVILQEVVGTQFGNLFYPHISGVARSLNYYTIDDEKPEEGVVSLALGLGKYIVDGGMTLRVNAYHPDHIMQLSETEFALRETQTSFYALDMNDVAKDFKVNDGFNIKRILVREAEKDGSLNYITSTFDPYDQVIRDGFYEGGRKIVSFSGVLKYDVFPLPKLLQLAQEYCQSEMRRPVEIEFAVKLNPDKTGTFYLLQVRPIVDAKKELKEDLTKISDGDVLLRSHKSLGHGIIDDVYDVVYVKTEGYNPSNNQLIAYDIEKMNRKFLESDTHYVLVGPGRWGSSDDWLGIPVKWPHISGAKVIVEAGLTDYRIDPSQGTHFFQNLTSLGVGYFTINDYLGDGVYNQKFLDSLPAVEETQYLRHVHFCKPAIIKMDGLHSEGVVMLPEKD